jgi:hypothetical protein
VAFEQRLIGGGTFSFPGVGLVIKTYEEGKFMASQKSPEIRNEFVGCIPIVKHYADRLKIVTMIDRAIPSAPQSLVSHGECVLALLISVLQGDHRLCFVEEKLRDVNLALLFGRKDIEAHYFNDTRLGAALDALFSRTKEIYGNIICAAILEFGIHPKRLHVDTTTVVLRGIYEVLEVLPSLREAPPLPARGHSKAHRPDLLQLMFGMVNSDEGIPLLGRFETGTELTRNYSAITWRSWPEGWMSCVQPMQFWSAIPNFARLPP